MSRTCPHCGALIKGHPNKVFCHSRCKDRYHNKRNPRGFQAARALDDDGEYSRHAETVHPFSQEAFEP
jgi:hypothetical protein